MGEQHMINGAHLGQSEVTNASARINQHVMVKQKRRGSAVFGDRP
jgi:predicted LPLAT superfamily acyltransferase